MEQDYSMETPFQSWLTWPNSLVPFLCWKSRKGTRRRLGGRTDTEQTARRERPHLPQEGRHSGLRPADPERSTGPGRRRGPDAAACPCRPHPVVPAEGFLRELRGSLRLKEAAFERLQGAARPRPGHPDSGAAPRRRPRGERKRAAWSSRRALSGAATLSTAPARRRRAGRGRRASRVRPRVPRDLCQRPAGALLGAWPLHPRDRLIRKHVADPVTTTALWAARSWGRCSCLGLGSEAAGRGRGRSNKPPTWMQGKDRAPGTRLPEYEA